LIIILELLRDILSRRVMLREWDGVSNSSLPHTKVSYLMKET